MYDAIIIGAGVCGCAIARELSRKQGKFLVLEKEEDVCCGTSKANSAICHAGYDAKHGTLMAELNVLGSRMMPELARELHFPCKNIGSLVVMLEESGRPRLEALYENGVRNGVQGLKILSREELLEMEPHISKDAVAALWAPTACIICPFELTFGLAENAAKNGVSFRFDTKVTGISPISGGWRLTTGQGSFDTRAVINAAGVYADELHNLVSPEPMTIVPRRGDYFLLDRCAEGYVNHIIFQLPTDLGKGVLVTPTVHGNTLVGPTAVDLQDKSDVATTQNSLDLIRKQSVKLVEGLPLNRTITSFAGLRAHDLRHEFTIGEAAPGFIDCAGIESPGLSSAPAIGVRVAELAAKILNLPDNPDFDPIRQPIPDPMKLAPEERNALIAAHPAYGNLICRCESVTEGQIIEAVHRVPGAKSVDGVKRRTRAGMGRCQSGFCAPRVMQIIARERGVPMSEITKSGGASPMILGTDKDQL